MNRVRRLLPDHLWQDHVDSWCGGLSVFLLACGFSYRRFVGYCDFDLANAEVQEARYFKVQDGERYPCPGDTPSEGADIDAVQILHVKP